MTRLILTSKVQVQHKEERKALPTLILKKYVFSSNSSSFIPSVKILFPTLQLNYFLKPSSLNHTLEDLLCRKILHHIRQNGIVQSTQVGLRDHLYYH